MHFKGAMLKQECIYRWSSVLPYNQSDIESASLIAGGNTSTINSSSEFSRAEGNTRGKGASRAISHAVFSPTPTVALASLPLVLTLSSLSSSSSPFAWSSFRLLLFICASSRSFAPPTSLLQCCSPPSATSSFSSTSSSTFTYLLFSNRWRSCWVGFSWIEVMTMIWS